MKRSSVTMIVGSLALVVVGGTTLATAQNAAVEAAKSPVTTSVASRPSAGQCVVTVDRSQAADVFQATEQKLNDGSCVCYIYTGPEGQGAATEAKITAIQASGSCSGEAPQVASGDSSSGGSPSDGKKLVPLYIGGGALGAGLLAAAVARGGNDNDSPGG